MPFWLLVCSLAEAARVASDSVVEEAEKLQAQYEGFLARIQRITPLVWIQGQAKADPVSLRTVIAFHYNDLHYVCT